MKILKTDTIESPVFKGDSIPSSYSKSLKKYFTGSSEASQLIIAVRNVKATGTDSVIYNNGSFLNYDWIVYKDSLNMLFAQYFPRFGRIIRSTHGQIRSQDQGGWKSWLSGILKLSGKLLMRLIH